MAYAFVMDVPAPIEFYDALHAEIGRSIPATGVDGMLLHVGRQTSGGFQIMEVWESRERYERFAAEVIGPAQARISGSQEPAMQPVVEEFEPRGLIVPAASVVV